MENKPGRTLFPARLREKWVWKTKPVFSCFLILFSRPARAVTEGYGQGVVQKEFKSEFRVSEISRRSGSIIRGFKCCP
jgi:hypothetical protein